MVNKIYGPFDYFIVAFYDCVGFTFKYHLAHIVVSRPEIKKLSRNESTEMRTHMVSYLVVAEQIRRKKNVSIEKTHQFREKNTLKWILYKT